MYSNQPNASDSLERLIQFLPFEIRSEVTLDIGSEEQTKVIQPLWRFPWQDTSRFAIDLDRWRRLSGDQQRMYFLREAVLATELALGDNVTALFLYPALLGVGAMGLLIELQLSDNLGIGLAGVVAALAFLLMRRSERGQKAQIAADEYAIRHASQNGISDKKAASLLLSAWKQVRALEGKDKESYDATMRQRNLEYISNRGLPATPKPDADSGSSESSSSLALSSERQRDFSDRDRF
ncbi:MAG: DUF3318 domain-containing protein [Cyanobacteria bacterium J06639_1]